MLHDLKTIVYKYAGVFYPMESIALLDDDVCGNWHKMNRAFRQAFIQKWTPSYCNVLKWVPTIHRFNPYLWHYDVLTHLHPIRKREVEQQRTELGYVAIYPGGRQYPTSRVRWDPTYTNDRYFR